MHVSKACEFCHATSHDSCLNCNEAYGILADANSLRHEFCRSGALALGPKRLAIVPLRKYSGEHMRVSMMMRQSQSCMCCLLFTLFAPLYVFAFHAFTATRPDLLKPIHLQMHGLYWHTKLCRRMVVFSKQHLSVLLCQAEAPATCKLPCGRWLVGLSFRMIYNRDPIPDNKRKSRTMLLSQDTLVHVHGEVYIDDAVCEPKAPNPRK